MAKMRAIVPICILLSSGCALREVTEVSTESESSPAPMMAVEKAPIPPAPPPEAEAAPAPPRFVTADDVRRVQMRLREVGLDPGPVDGIAGAKTRLAFSRLQTGCMKLEESSAHRPLASQQGGVGSAKALTRDEVMQIQTELRAAGFNPGAIDGIYGLRTRGLVSQLAQACAVANEFRSLDGADDGAKNQIAARGPTESKLASASSPGARSDDGARETPPMQTAQRREEIRILQLRLRDAGFDPGPFDGIMGARTRVALAQYEASQKNSKIKTSLTSTRITGQY